MTKKLDALVGDIYNLFSGEESHYPEDNNMRILLNGIAKSVRLKMLKNREWEPRLRMSNIGKPDRQVWYELNKAPREKMSPNTYIKFLLGDIIEELFLFLAKEAGHDVQAEQKEIEIDGIKGRMDAIIDGVVVDIKSASSYSFKKFRNNTLAEDDPFGYIDQISGYAQAEGDEYPAFLAVDKQNGSAVVTRIEAKDVKPRIKQLKKLLDKDTPPEKCYSDKAEGASGNRILAIGCAYCGFKNHCWSDANDGKGIRTFAFTHGIKHYTKISREPKGKELHVRTNSTINN